MTTKAPEGALCNPLMPKKGKNSYRSSCFAGRKYADAQRIVDPFGDANADGRNALPFIRRPQCQSRLTVVSSMTPNNTRPTSSPGGIASIVTQPAGSSIAVFFTVESRSASYDSCIPCLGWVNPKEPSANPQTIPVKLTERNCLTEQGGKPPSFSKVKYITFALTGCKFCVKTWISL